jgi:DNA-binding LytR/AlgR family response regulator
LKKEDILYVESRDSEVWIVTRDGRQYRNKTGIGQWENLLGPGFLRIHRSFLVNLSDATLTTPDLVTIAGQSIPVSRKYKDSVKAVL